MKPEKLAEIREWNRRTFATPLSEPWMVADEHVKQLLAEVDRLRAENDNLRVGAKSFVRQVDRLADGIKRIEPILSLLHNRGLVDSQYNRDDVRDALSLCHALLNDKE